MSVSALNIAINLQAEGAISGIQKLNVQFKGLGDMVRSMRNISMVQMVQGIQDFSQGIKEAVQPGVDFQQQLADLEAITGVTGKDLVELGNYSRQVGKESGLGASQAVEAFKLLASNIDITTIGGVEGLKLLQDATIKLSQAAGTDLPMAANTMAGTINQFKLPVSEATRVINVLGAGAKYGAPEIPDLAESLKNTGAVAAIAGVSLESTVGALEILSQNMIKGAEAGTGLRNVILRLQTKEIPGIDLKTQGLSGALSNLKSKLNDAKFMADVFGVENIAVAQTLIKNAAEVENMTQKVTGTNVAYEQAAIRTNTYQHSVDLLKANMDDFKISIFNATGAFLSYAMVVGESIASFSMLLPGLSILKDGIMGTIGHFGGLIKQMRAAKTAQQALSLAFTASPIGWFVAGLTIAAGAFLLLRNNMNSATGAQKAFTEVQILATRNMIIERTEADRLFDALKKTKPESEERKKVIEEMNAKYPEYLKNMDLERGTAEQIAEAYKNVITQIDRKAKKDATQSLYTEAYQKLLESQIKAKDEYWHGSVSGMKKSKSGEKLYIDQKTREEQKDFTSIKSVRDEVYFQTLSDEASKIVGKVPGSKPNPLSGLTPLKETDKTVSSITGDSKAIKNFNININAPMIGTNQNIVNNTPGDFDHLKTKMKELLTSILNDLNYSV